MSNVLDAEVSWFDRWSEPDKPRGPVKLSYWLTRRSAVYDKQVDQIRATTDEKERKDLKNRLPGITPHGKFRYRNASPENLIHHSGILCIDLDEKDNRHLADFDQMKAYMSQLPEVAYCGLSVSGNGYFVLAPIAYPDQHAEQFNALIELFADMNVKVDTSGRNIDRFRFYSYDPDPYINQNAVRFTGLPRPKPVPVTRRTFHVAAPAGEGVLITRLADIVRNAGDGQKHHELLKAARLAGGFVAGGQLPESTAIEILEYEISNRPDVADLQAAYKTIQAGIAYGLKEPIYPDERPVYSPPADRASSVSRATRPGVVSELSEWNGTDILRPDESQLERLTDYPDEPLPAEWNQVSSPDPPLLTISPNRSAFAACFGMVPNQLPLYRLARPG